MISGINNLSKKVLIKYAEEVILPLADKKSPLVKILVGNDLSFAAKLNVVLTAKKIFFPIDVPVTTVHYYWTLSYILSKISKEARILEIGAYLGSFLKVLKLCGYSNISGIDYNNDFISIAKLMGSPVTCQDVLKSDLKQESFDFIVCVNFFYEDPKGKMDESIILKVLSKTHQLLKINGQVYIKPCRQIPIKRICQVGFEIVSIIDADYKHYVLKKIKKSK